MKKIVRFDLLTKMKIYLLLIFLYVLNLPILKAQVVTAFAGSGAYGSVNSTGILASFNLPADVAVDASGNVYVADLENNKIRKITSEQVVTTLAGSGTRGSVDATGTLASFNRPHGVAVDASGNVYVADEYNNKIRKITPAGVVTTLAGSGDFGSIDDTGTLASFNAPNDVAVDASGNVYVADTYNHKIRKITPVGVVTTLAGSGTTGSIDATGTSASFYYPSGVAVDASGIVYVGDTWNNKIRKITPGGVVTTFAGSGTTGSMDVTGTSASFNYPWGVAVDVSGNVYVADQNNNKIRKITSAQMVTTLAGSGTSGSVDATGTSASFRYPSGVAVDALGNVYIADELNNKIRKISFIKIKMF
jgi:sugar lactone lactonase YvrE